MEETGQKNSYYGAPFKQYIESLGGLHDGILLPRVYREDPSDLQVQLSLQTVITLPHAGVLTQEFGTVILKWYSDHYKGIFDVHRQFYVDNFAKLKEYLEELAPLLVSNDEAKVKRAIKKQIKVKKEVRLLAEIQKEVFIPGFNDMKSINIAESSSSSSDNLDIDVFYTQRITAVLKSEIQTNHAIHKIFRYIRAFYDNDFAKSIHSYIIENLHSEKDPLFGENWHNISEKFNNYIAHLPIEPKKINAQLEKDFQSEIKKLYFEERKTLGSVDIGDYIQLEQQKAELEEQRAELEATLEQKAELEEQRAELEEQRAELEAMLEQKAELEATLEQQKAELEAALKRLEEKDQRIAKLERKYEQRQKSSPFPHSEQSSPSPESHSFTSPVHSEKSPPLSPSFPITFVTEIEMENESKSDLKRKLKEKEEESESKLEKSEELLPLSPGCSFTPLAEVKMAESESKRESDLKRKQREGESNVTISSPPRKKPPL